MSQRVICSVIASIMLLFPAGWAMAQSIPEVEPNDTPAQCQMLSSLPAVITGEVNGSYDYFCFTLAGGEILGFDIDAEELGSPLDS